MSRSTQQSKTVIGLAQPAPEARPSARIIEMHPGETVRRRIQRVSPLARACGDASPDLEAKVAKQTEKPVPGLPGVVEITYRKGA